MPSRDATEVIRFLEQHSGWLLMNDLRVGQFLQNVATFMGYDDPFYMENSTLVDGMRQYVRALEKK